MDKIVHRTKPNKKSLPGFFEPTIEINLHPHPSIQTIPGFSSDDAVILTNILSKDVCNKLIDYMHTSDNFESVGVQGMIDNEDKKIGSLRTSIWTPNVAEQIWDKIKTYLSIQHCDNNKATDWWQGLCHSVITYNNVTTYVPVAVSPLLRFMKYGKNGQHYAHYDASFIYPDNEYRSLKSMIIYLTSNDGAATRFINDGQSDIDIWNRKHEDWNRPVTDDEIIGKSECIQGNVLIFDHRICHDVQKYMGDDVRIIIRGDIIYKLNI
jgi:hypothetical protein